MIAAGTVVRKRATITVMLFAAKVWHYWIGFVLWFATVATVVGLVVGYLVKVQRPQYPRRGQQRPE